MTLQNSRAEDCELFSRIKELSGKLIERRRRRDHVSQRHLAEAVGRSERWVREIEAGASTSMLEDHIRCAHSLQMATPHLFIPLLAMEHNVDLARSAVAGRPVGSGGGYTGRDYEVPGSYPFQCWLGGPGLPAIQSRNEIPHVTGTSCG
jgi:DNA-binding XRE family transcriptional regulator